MKLPVVYTMGKVASTSVTRAITAAGLRCHHIHTLDRNYLITESAHYAAKGEPPPLHYSTSLEWDHEIVDTTKCFYISLVRDPIERNLSALFQNLNFDGWAPSAVIEHFETSYSHNLPANWFDAQFRRFLRIDVFATPFDKLNRYVLNDQFLIMRTDLDDDTKTRLLQIVTGRHNIVVRRQNVGGGKRCNGLYGAVLKEARFSKEFVEQMYSTKFARHFWTEDELNGFRWRWTG